MINDLQYNLENKKKLVLPFRFHQMESWFYRNAFWQD